MEYGNLLRPKMFENIKKAVKSVAPYYNKKDAEQACDKLIRDSVAYWKRVLLFI